MASLGLLVRNVVHTINTPIGTVKSSGAFIAETLDTTLADMPRLFSMLHGAPESSRLPTLTPTPWMALFFDGYTVQKDVLVAT